jgi:hypothetical protein
VGAGRVEGGHHQAHGWPQDRRQGAGEPPIVFVSWHKSPFTPSASLLPPFQATNSEIDCDEEVAHEIMMTHYTGLTTALMKAKIEFSGDDDACNISVSSSAHLDIATFKQALDDALEFSVLSDNRCAMVLSYGRYLFDPQVRKSRHKVAVARRI